MAPRGADTASAVNSSTPQRVFLGGATSTAPAHGWAGEEPAPGAAVTHFRGNTGPIWQSTWLQHGKPRGAPCATSTPAVPAPFPSQTSIPAARAPTQRWRRDSSRAADTAMRRCPWHVHTCRAPGRGHDPALSTSTGACCCYPKRHFGTSYIPGPTGSGPSLWHLIPPGDKTESAPAPSALRLPPQSALSCPTAKTQTQLQEEWEAWLKERGDKELLGDSDQRANEIPFSCHRGFLATVLKQGAKQ